MLQLGLGLGTGNGYFIAFFSLALKWQTPLSCPHGLGLVRTPREDPRTPVGNTGHPSEGIQCECKFITWNLFYIFKRAVPPPPPSQALSCVANIYGNLRSKNSQRRSLCEKTLKKNLTDAAYKTFRKISANLIKIIQDHDLPRLKWELHSTGVVSISVAEKVSMDQFFLERRLSHLACLETKPVSILSAKCQY